MPNCNGAVVAISGAPEQFTDISLDGEQNMLNETFWKGMLSSGTTGDGNPCLKHNSEERSVFCIVCRQFDKAQKRLYFFEMVNWVLTH